MKPTLLFFALPIALIATPTVVQAQSTVKPVTATDTQAIYNRALVLAKKGDYAGATTLCRQILAKMPTVAPVWATMARLLSQQGQSAAAIAAGEKAVALSPKVPAFRADLADFYLRANNNAKAEAMANSALKLAPKNDVALSVLTTIRLTSRKYKEAIPLLNRLQAGRGGKDRAIAQNLVSSYVHLGDKPGALKAAQAYSQLAPKDAEAMLAVIDFAIETKNITVANAYIVKLAKVAKDSPLPSYYQGRVTLMDEKTPLETRFTKAEKSYQKAVDIIQKAVDTSSTNVDLGPQVALFRSQLAFTQLGQGDKKKWNAVRSNLTAALLYDNHNIPSRRGMALLDEQEELWDDAAVQYEAYLQLSPNESDQRRRYAGVLLKAGRRTEAYAQFRKLAEMNPENIVYLKELASYLINDKNYTEARGTYAMVLERNRDDAEAELGVARCFVAENRPREARAAYDRAIAANPKGEDGYLLLAQLYVDNQDNTGATETLERGLKTNPNANRVRWQLIEQYIAAKRDDDARRLIANLTLQGAGENRNLYRLVGGNLYMAREKYAAAVTEFERIQHEEPDNPQVLLALAGAYDKAGRAEDASKTYEAAAKAAEALLVMPEHHKNSTLRDVLTKARTAQKKPEQANEFIKYLDTADDSNSK